MDLATFWSVIEKSKPKHTDDQEAQLHALHEELARLPATDVVDFDRLLHAQLKAANRWDLWGAAYLMMGGCSDDAFEYFRAWLVARGKDAFERVTKHPDDLAEIAPDADDDLEFESFIYVPDQVYEDLTGESIDLAAAGAIRDPKGKQWDFEDDDEMKRRYPKIWNLQAERE
jgi:hypothetical protein